MTTRLLSYCTIYNPLIYNDTKPIFATDRLTENRVWTVERSADRG